MLESEREEELLKALLLLKEESQRLIRRHREIMQEYDSVVHELYMLRKARQRRRGHDFSSQFDPYILPAQKRGAPRVPVSESVSPPQAPTNGAAKNRGRSNHS
jgi:hypothetical protein